MFQYISRRLFQSFFTFIGITFIAYFIMDSAPGNPASQLTLNPELTQQQRNAMAATMGVNDPFLEKYAYWMLGEQPITIAGTQLWAGRAIPVFDRKGEPVIIEDPERCEVMTRENGEVIMNNRTGQPALDKDTCPRETVLGRNLGLIRGDLGHSLVSRRPVLDLIEIRIWATLELGLLSLGIGLLIGIPTGVLAAIYQGGIFDQATRIMSVLVSSIPVFWLGLILIIIFNNWLELLPSGNRFPISITGDYSTTDRIRHIILPTLTLSSFTIATFSRFMRASVLDVLNQDYIRTAKAKGLFNNQVWFIHAMRNALIPIATLLGPSITGVIAGALLTESIYTWPGMGRMIFEAIASQDYPVIMAAVLIFSVATIIGYLISDILYAIFDPRIRLS